MTSLWFVRLPFEGLVADFKANSRLGSSPPTSASIEILLSTLSSAAQGAQSFREMRFTQRWGILDLSLIGLNFCMWTHTCLTRGGRMSEPLNCFVFNYTFKSMFCCFFGKSTYTIGIVNIYLSNSYLLFISWTVEMSISLFTEVPSS